MSLESGNTSIPIVNESTCPNHSNNYHENTMEYKEVMHPSLRTLQRPRGALARQLYDKILADERLEDFDKNKWFECDLRDLPSHLVDRFVLMSPDEETEAFLEQSREKSDWILTQLWHSFARSVLGWFMTQTSINGLLGRGSMFVFSRKQFMKLLDGLDIPQRSCYPAKDVDCNGIQAKSSSSISNGLWKPPEDVVEVTVDERKEIFFKGSLLDLGAGDGGITDIIAPLFQDVYVTEISPTMKRTLARKGFHVLTIDSWSTEETVKPSIAMCLNLLDRCDKPLTLLSSLWKVLKRSENNNPLLIIALVLPYSTYVEAGSRGDHKPVETIKLKGKTFEEQVISCEKDLFNPAGFQIIKWTRLPYLCEGDLRQAYYWLSDAVFVLKPTPELPNDSNISSNTS